MKAFMQPRVSHNGRMLNAVSHIHLGEVKKRHGTEEMRRGVIVAETLLSVGCRLYLT